MIPAQIRRALAIESGDSLVARLAGEQFIIEKHATIEARVLDRLKQFEGRSLADELIAERHNEARKELRG